MKIVAQFKSEKRNIQNILGIKRLLVLVAMLVMVCLSGHVAYYESASAGSSENVAVSDIIVKKQTDNESKTQERFKFKIRSNRSAELGVVTGPAYLEVSYADNTFYSSDGSSMLRKSMDTEIGIETSLAELGVQNTVPGMIDFFNGKIPVEWPSLFIVKSWDCGNSCPPAMQGNNILYYGFSDGWDCYPIEYDSGQFSYNGRILNEGTDYIDRKIDDMDLHPRPGALPRHLYKIAEGVPEDSFNNLINSLQTIKVDGISYVSEEYQHDSFIERRASVKVHNTLTSDNGELKLEENGDYSFYLSGGDSITIRFSEQPLSPEQQYEIWEEELSGWKLIDIDGDNTKERIKENIPIVYTDTDENPDPVVHIFRNERTTNPPEKKEEAPPKHIVESIRNNPETGDRKIAPLVIMMGSAVMLILALVLRQSTASRSRE